MPSQSEVALLPNAQQLVELMQEIRFGRIEGLTVRGGQPVFDPPPRVVREIKLGSVADEPNTSNFASKPQARELFAIFDELGNGVIDCIEVRHGLAFRVVMTESPFKLEGKAC